MVREPGTPIRSWFALQIDELSNQHKPLEVNGNKLAPIEHEIRGWDASRCVQVLVLSNPSWKPIEAVLKVG
jgi:hypothetical protein